MSREATNIYTKRVDARETLSLVAPLGKLFFLGRSGRYDPARARVLREAEFLAGIKATGRGKDPQARAARGRFLRLLGRFDEARVELDAAARAGLPEGLAFRWELSAAQGRRDDAGLEEALTIAPDDAVVRSWLAVKLAEMSRWDEAAAEAARAAERAPRAAFPRFVQGLALLRGGDRAGSIAAFGEGLTRAPKTEWALRARAVALHESGDEAACLEDCFSAMRLNEMIGTLFIPLGLYQKNLATRECVDAATARIDEDPSAWWARVYRSDYRREPSINENAGAVQDLRDAIRARPQVAWTWAYLARCQTAAGDFSGARESLEKAHELDPECGWILAWRGEGRRRAGDPKGALSDLERALTLEPDYELAYAWRGGAKRSLGKVKEAVADLTTSIRLDPTYVEWCHFERFNALRDLGRVGDALEDLREAHRLNPKFVYETDPKKFSAAIKGLLKVPAKDPRRALALSWAGELELRRRDFAAADAVLSKAVAADPKLASARTLRGRARGELGQWKTAMADFESAVSLEPHFGVAKAWRGRAKLMLGDADGAAADLAAALESRTEKAAAWILQWKAEAELAAGRTADAEASASLALEVHPRYMEARLTRGLAREKLGRHAEALDDVEKACALAPDAPAPAETRERLRLALETDDDAGIERRAERLSQEGQHAQAEQAYDALLASRPKDAVILKKRADARRRQGKYDGMVDDLSLVARTHPKDAGARVALGDARRHAYDLIGALADAEAALVMDPRSGYAWVLKAEAERGLGRGAESVASAAKAVAADSGWTWAPVVSAKAKRFAGELPGAETDTRLAEKAGPDHYALGWRAEILRKAGRLKEALVDATAAVKLQPGIAWFRALRGEILRDLGKKDEGWKEFALAVRTDGNCSCAFDFLGAEPASVKNDKTLAWVYAWRGGVARKEGRLDAARADLEHAARLDPKAGWIAAWQGELALHEGRLDDAKTALDRAVKDHPTLVPARVWRGQVHFALGKTADARKDFDAALAADPDEPFAVIGTAACLEKAGKLKQAAALFARAKALAPGLFEEAAA